MSKKIRWSLDLRWQRPSEPVGFYGLKQGILMRTSKDPNYKIDWESFNKIDRHQKQKEATKDLNENVRNSLNFFFLISLKTLTYKIIYFMHFSSKIKILCVLGQ